MEKVQCENCLEIFEFDKLDQTTIEPSCPKCGWKEFSDVLEDDESEVDEQ